MVSALVFIIWIGIVCYRKISQTYKSNSVIMTLLIILGGIGTLITLFSLIYSLLEERLTTQSLTLPSTIEQLLENWNLTYSLVAIAVIFVVVTNIAVLIDDMRLRKVLNKLSISALHSIAHNNGVKNYITMSTIDLVKAIMKLNHGKRLTLVMVLKQDIDLLRELNRITLPELQEATKNSIIIVHDSTSKDDLINYIMALSDVEKNAILLRLRKFKKNYGK